MTALIRTALGLGVLVVAIGLLFSTCTSCLAVGPTQGGAVRCDGGLLVVLLAAVVVGSGWLRYQRHRRALDRLRGRPTTSRKTRVER